MLAILVAVILTDCGGDNNVNTESDSEPATEARFAAIGWQDGTIALDWLTIQFNAGDNQQTVQGSQLTVGEDYGQPHSEWFSTDSQGPLSEGRVELGLRNDWLWEVQYHLARTSG